MPRPFLLLHLLSTCSFCVLAVIVGNGVLLAVPQAREALRLFSENDDWTHRALFLLAVYYWAFIAWFVSRLLLGREIKRDSSVDGPSNSEKQKLLVTWWHSIRSLLVKKGRSFPIDTLSDDDAKYVRRVAKYLPRVLGVGAPVPLMFFFTANKDSIAILLFGCTLLFGVFVWGRRSRPKLHKLFVDTNTTDLYGYFVKIGPKGRLFIEGLFVVSFWILLALWLNLAARVAIVVWLVILVYRLYLPFAHQCKGPHFATWLLLFIGGLLSFASWHWPSPVEIAREIGAPALLLFALGSWTLFGGFVLTYLPRIMGCMPMAFWLPPLLYLAFEPFNENHYVAQMGSLSARDQSSSAWRNSRLELTNHFNSWMHAHAPAQPVYFVAIAGGASRAGYWAGSLLGRLEDDTASVPEARRIGFSRNLFLISSISGGSLGAAAFVTDLARGPCPTMSDQCHRERIDAFQKKDSLSPVIGMMLFPDLFQRFLPPLGRVSDLADRSLALEKGWQDDWAELAKGEAAADWWRMPLTSVYGPSPKNSQLPALVLNTVRLEDGRRLLQSNLATNLNDADDLFQDRVLDVDQLSLAGAVHNSARFPYISPPGAVLLTRAEGSKRAPVWGHLGDGGYYEASGAATLADILEQLIATKQIRMTQTVPATCNAADKYACRQRLWACAGEWQSTEGADCTMSASPVVIIFVESAPSNTLRDKVRDLGGKARAMDFGYLPARLPQSEVLGPVIGGLTTRSQQAYLSVSRLSRIAGIDPAAFIELGLPVDDGIGQDVILENHEVCARPILPSMTWGLDACSRAYMDQQSGPRADCHTLAQQALQNNLSRLRETLKVAQTAAECSATGSLRGKVP